MDFRTILDFEESWSHATPSWGSKDQAILAELKISPTVYHQVLQAALDLPDAYVYNPLLIKRLRRLRDQRRAARAERSL